MSIVYVILLFTQLNEPLEDKTIVNLPTNVSFGISQPAEYSYRVKWTHSNGFHVIGQYKKDELTGMFVLYNGIGVLKPNQILNFYKIQFFRVGTAIYHKRLLHIFYPIILSENKDLDKIYDNMQAKIENFYGKF